MINEPILNNFEVLKSSLVKAKTLSFSLFGESKPLTTKAKKKDSKTEKTYDRKTTRDNSQDSLM